MSVAQKSLSLLALYEVKEIIIKIEATFNSFQSFWIAKIY